MSILAVAGSEFGDALSAAVQKAGGSGPFPLGVARIRRSGTSWRLSASQTTIIRFIAEERSALLGKSVIVENKSGAGGMVAAIDVFHKTDSKGCEQGIPLVAQAWLGICAARGTPAPVFDLLNRKIAEVTRLPEYKELTEKTGTIPASSTPAELGKIITDSANDNVEIIRRFNLQVD